MENKGKVIWPELNEEYTEEDWLIEYSILCD